MRRALDLVADDDERSDALEIQVLFEDRVREFWDIVSMCLTSPRQDELTHTYQAGAMPKPLNRWGFWCPIAERQQELANWMDYNPRVREAIRRSFRRGIGRLTDWYLPETLENWLKYEPGLMYKMPPYIEIISAEAEKTGQYALAQARMELLLKDIYQEAKHIPYHPEFDRVFKAKLTGLPLHRINDFLSETCYQNNLETSEGYTYLADLVTEVAEIDWLNHPSKTDRACTWVAGRERSALATESKGSFSRNRRPVKLGQAAVDSVSPFAKLLLNYTEEALTELLKDVGLVDDNGLATAAATPQLWCGIIYALRESDPPRIKENSSRSAKALQQVFGATISASTITNGPGKSGSAGDKLRIRVLELIKN